MAETAPGRCTDRVHFPHVAVRLYSRAQMLAAVPQNLVLSEAGPIDAVVRANTRDPQLTDAEPLQLAACHD